MKLDAISALWRSGSLRAPRRSPAAPGAHRRRGAAGAGCRWPAMTTQPCRTAPHFASCGARICEFPMAEEVGEAARAAGDWVVMGSPNVVRGRSHLGWASAARLAEAGICNVLSSDYYYPAMLRAALILAGRGVLDLPRAWALISANPARAAGLSDRGTISAGKRGDITIIDIDVPQVVATLAAGRIGFLTQSGAQRRIR